MPVSPKSHFRDQLRAIGQAMEEQMPQPFFSVDAALDSQSRQLGVWAGRIPAVEKASWPLATARTDIAFAASRPTCWSSAIPRNFHYGAGMGSNPILMMQAVGASVIRAKRALVDKPIVIAAAVCDGWFNDAEFPPYSAVFDLLQNCQHPADMVAHEEELATDPGWVYRYRYEYGYHPFHAFSMVYVGGIAREYSPPKCSSPAPSDRTTPGPWVPAPPPPSRRHCARRRHPRPEAAGARRARALQAGLPPRDRHGRHALRPDFGNAELWTLNMAQSGHSASRTPRYRAGDDGSPSLSP